ncbi:MAG: 8-amino-7-oxononanoate synthase [Nitrospirae bacterium]|nr:8-amino-7-oxononanoate synthase [Nitrospirota bacterium]
MFKEELSQLKKQNLLRQLVSRSSAQGPVITIGRRKYINFSSNDYLGLACHPEVIRAASDSLGRYGFGSGSSRLLGGGSLLHERLEREIASFKSAEAAMVFNSGYAANTGIIPALASGKDVIFSDELNHASIIDGCRLSRARMFIFRHKDVTALEGLLKKEKKARRRVVITDTVFSMDGDIAPLDRIAGLCRRHNAFLYIDDSHGTGVLGDGRGALAHYGIGPEPWIIQMGTFSKALGSFGAFAAGSGDIIDYFINTVRSFIYSTALPSSVIAASLKALKILRKDEDDIVGRLWTNRTIIAEGLRDMGFDIMGSETPIIPVMTGSVKEAVNLSGYLYENGIYAPSVRPPSVIEPRLRISVSAAHGEVHLEKLLKTMGRAKKTAGTRQSAQG